ncbi:hypothetical protein [Streptomyces violascens]|uniref:hypothetical protein n=1 Tax=Streptomyces violascens TaxID=67381 RepID=UPI003690DAB5
MVYLPTEVELSFRHTSSEPETYLSGPLITGEAQALKEMVDSFSSLRERYGGSHARTSLVSYLADDANRILMIRRPAPARANIVANVAKLTHLLAKMTTDAGYHGLAYQYYLDAMQLAQESRNPSLQAIVLRSMATQANKLGHYQYALKLAEASADAAAINSLPAVQAYVLAGRAVLYAAGRQHKLAEVDLVKADSLHKDTNGGGGPYAEYPRAALEYQLAQALLARHDYDAAIKALHDSIRHRALDQHRALAITLASLAETLLRVGHLEAACAQWDLFLRHLPYARIPVTNACLATLHTSLRPHRNNQQAAVVLARWY